MSWTHQIPRTFVLTVDRPIQRYDECAAHLAAEGIAFERFNGMDNQICRLNPVDTFDHDRVGERIAPKHIAATLTHYMAWKVMSWLPEDFFWALEYDVRMTPNWRAAHADAMRDLPDDWDIVFLGSCCCGGKPKRRIGQNLFEVKHPLCGHAMMYRKKALPVLLREHQKICAPLDIAMMLQSLPLLRVYTILPSMIVQHNTPLPP
jgi:GR25 family glycosyltransferase involved in LPS biosynthesis